MFSFRLLILLGVAVSAGAQAPAAIRVLLGATDTESTSWDGGIRARGARIVSMEPWRFAGSDALDGNRWRASTHPARRFGAANQGAPPTVVANGVVITLSGQDSTELEFETYRTAVAIDGKRRTWVFWSQNTRDNFEIFARSVAGGERVETQADPGGVLPEAAAEAGAVKRIRDYRAGDYRVVRGEFHRHSEMSADGGSDGSLLDQWRYALDAGALNWVGCCDHDNGNGREYTWWITQKLTAIFYTPGVFVPMYSCERSVPYPEGHRNVIFAQRGIRPLPRLPITAADSAGHAPDTRMLYAYLKHFDGIVASHTSGTNMGTDWRDNDPAAEPVVEIYRGDRQNYEMPDAPRSNPEADSIGGWRPKGFVNLALEKGYMMGFEASSDHISTHISYCNIYVKGITRESVLDAFKKRHVFAATDNILADVRSGDHMMGDVFATASPPAVLVKLTGTAKFAKVHVIKDNAYVYSAQPGSADVQFSWVRQRSGCREDELLLCARGTGGWATRLGIPHVDHLQPQTITHG